MPDPLVSTDIAPGEYAVAGTDQLLVIEGRAYWRSPSTPAPLIKPAATPAAASSTLANVFKWVAAAASLIATGAYVGPAVADRMLPPAPAPIIVEVPATPAKPARPPGTQNHSPHSPNYHPLFGPAPALPSPQYPG